MTRPSRVGHWRSRGAVVTLTALTAVGLGGACSSGGGVARVDQAKAPATSAPTGVARYRATTPVLDVAAPVRLEIQSIGVSTDLDALGLNPDGTMQVPTNW